MQVRGKESGSTRPASRASLNGPHERIIGKVAVPLGTLMVGMTEDATDGIEVYPRVDHERRRRVPQVVDAKVGKLCRLPRLVPSPLDVGQRLQADRVR